MDPYKEEEDFCRPDPEMQHGRITSTCTALWEAPQPYTSGAFIMWGKVFMLVASAREECITWEAEAHDCPTPFEESSSIPPRHCSTLMS